MADKLRRSILLIEPYKQLRFGILFLLLNFVFAAVSFGVFYHFISDIEQVVELYFKLDAAQIEQVHSKFLQPVFVLASLCAGFILLTLFMSVKYTHQFYGPLVSIHRFLDDLKDGKDPDPIKIRPDDQLQGLVERLNEYVEQRKRPKS